MCICSTAPIFYCESTKATRSQVSSDYNQVLNRLFYTYCNKFQFFITKYEWEFVPECEPRVGLSFQRVARGQTHPDNECVQILIISDLDLRFKNVVFKKKNILFE